MSRHRVERLPRAGEVVRFAPAERRHLERALRMKPGDAIVVFDGSGLEAAALIREHPEGGWAAILTESPRPAGVELPQLTVLMALVKGERPAQAVEKLTELGTESIVLFRADRSVRAASDELLRRLATHADAAVKQCGRTRPPSLSLCENLESAIENADSDAANWVLDPRSDVLLADGLAESGAEAAGLAIGPEGGWTERESAVLARAGWRRAALAAWTLRADTAAVAAAAVALSALRQKKMPATVKFS